MTKPDGASRTTYSNYATDYQQSQKSRPMYAQETMDDDYEGSKTNDYNNYGKTSANNSYAGLLSKKIFIQNVFRFHLALLARSNSYNGLQSRQGQQRVISRKEAGSSSSALQQVNSI